MLTLLNPLVSELKRVLDSLVDCPIFLALLEIESFLHLGFGYNVSEPVLQHSELFIGLILLRLLYLELHILRLIFLANGADLGGELV